MNMIKFLSIPFDQCISLIIMLPQDAGNGYKRYNSKVNSYEFYCLVIHYLRTDLVSWMQLSVLCR